MATHNGAVYVRAQLDSLAAQVHRPTEVIVVDDASADRTLDLVGQFAGDAPFAVRIERNALPVGPTATFERALRLSSGEIVFFSDQDDVWMPLKIASMAAFMADRPDVMIAICDQINTGENLQHQNVTAMMNAKAVGLSRDLIVAGCATVIRRSFLSAVLPVPDGEVYDNWMHALGRHLRVRAVVEEPLQYWRRHEATVSHHEIASVSLIKRKPGRSLSNADRWPDEIRRNRILLTRLEALGDNVDNPLSEAARRAIPSLRARTDAIAARLWLVRQPRWRRPRPILSMFTRGDYRHFRGARSAFADLLLR
jgi:glycosyltransferase involved in cell wall biosynthesis